MKHRSLFVFILIAIGLAAVPQAADQFAYLREAAGRGSKAGIWSVFLRYHT
jgi:hypothetical protein